MEKIEIAAAKIQISIRGLSWTIPAATIRTRAGRQGFKYRGKKNGRATETVRTTATGTTSHAKTRICPQKCTVRPRLCHSRHTPNAAIAAAIDSSVRSQNPPLPPSIVKKSSTERPVVGGIHPVCPAPTLAITITIGIIKYANKRMLRAKFFQERWEREGNGPDL